MPPLRQHFDAGGNCFSFAPPGGGTTKGHPAGGEGGTELAGARTSRVKGGYGGYFGRPRDLVAGGWGSYGRDRSAAVDGEELSRLTGPEEERPDDGGGSPVLWGAARPPRLIPVCPGSQAQIMAKYRQEMMDLVKGAPETAYELSLRDLVEVQRTAAQGEKEGGVRGETGAAASAGRGRGREKGSSKKKIMLRSTSMDSGVFRLRMFFPASLGGRRAAPGVAGSTGSKVSPRPSPADVKKGRQEKKVDAGLPDELGRSSTERRKWIGCFPFLINEKSDDGEGKKHTCPCRL